MKRRYFHILMCLMVSIFFLLPFFQHASGKEAGKNKASDLAQGQRIYEVSCVLCHGSQGKGDGPASIFIGPYSHPRPNDFTRGVFKYRTTDTGDMPIFSDLTRTISYGIPGYMPSFKHLGEEGVRQVALYISSRFIEEALSLESMDGLNYGEINAIAEKNDGASDSSPLNANESGRVRIYKQIAGILKNISQNALAAIAQKEDPELALSRYRQIIAMLNRIVSQLETRSRPSMTAQKAEPHVTPEADRPVIRRYMNQGNAGISLEKDPASPSLAALEKLETGIFIQSTTASHRLKSEGSAASLSLFSDLYIEESDSVSH